jgi:co-chaperonin GroES (HSP10)
LQAHRLVLPPKEHPLAKQKDICHFLEPLESGLIVEQPKAVGGHAKGETKSKGGVILIDQKATLRETFGCVTKVLKAHKDLAKTFPKGSSILIHEHGGCPVYSPSGESKAWVISEGDILAKVNDDYWKHFSA